MNSISCKIDYPNTAIDKLFKQRSDKFDFLRFLRI